MSFLIKQSELNDCGAAICTMVLNQFGKKWSLEAFKVYHQYQHEPYSFAKMEMVLKNHQIKSQSYQFTEIDELKTVKTFFCFQVVNKFGQEHFVLATYLNHQRWIVYDPNKPFKQILNDQQLLAMSTKMVQIYEAEFKSTKVNYQFGKIFKAFFKDNFYSFILNNLLWVVNLGLTILVGSFLRIIFQEYQVLTLNRVFLLATGLVLLICLNWIFNYLLNRLNLYFANRFFQRILEMDFFQKQFFQAKQYLSDLDFEKTYFQFQTNIVNLFTVMNQSFGLIISCFLLGFYFYQLNLLLFLTSSLLISFLLVIKIFKLFYQRKQVQKMVAKQNLFFSEFRFLMKNSLVIKNKTTLSNYLKLKKNNYLLSFQMPHFSEHYHYLERICIYGYYLILSFLIRWEGQEISSLIIFTTISIVFSQQVEQLIQAIINFDWKNYFNQNLYFSKLEEEKSSPLKVTFNGQELENNYLIINLKQLVKVEINDQPWKSFYNQIYYANEAISFEETIYNNLFNYRTIDLEIFQKAEINQWIIEFELNLEAKPTLENSEIIKYLSVYFAKQKIVILNYPKTEIAFEKLINYFPKKTFLFLNEEI